jgi:hypothetical protein
VIAGEILPQQLLWSHHAFETERVQKYLSVLIVM